MRHRKKGRKLNRTWSHRKAMMRTMVTTFIDQEQIETTDAKAKELRPLAERLVTLAKRGGDDLAARRRALKVIRDKKVVSKLFTEIGPRYADRPGGYTRIVKVEHRRGDGAPLSILKFVTEPVTFKERRQKPEEEFDRMGPAATAAATSPRAEAPADESPSDVDDSEAPATDEPEEEGSEPSEETPTDVSEETPAEEEKPEEG
jgi:large subunit ribosomal protein L17